MEGRVAASDKIEAREMLGLIGSDKVEGIEVYRPGGDRVGIVDRVMIDKATGKVAYAVMSFGGFLGIGRDHYPVPWPLLTYNERLGGYEVNVTEAQLKKAPRFGAGEPWEYENRAQERALYSHYGVAPYW